MACVYREYEVKLKMARKQWLQLKMKLLLSYKKNYYLAEGNQHLQTLKFRFVDNKMPKQFQIFFICLGNMSAKETAEDP